MTANEGLRRREQTIVVATPVTSSSAPAALAPLAKGALRYVTASERAGKQPSHVARARSCYNTRI